MDKPDSIASVIRVTRHDTLQIRSHVTQLQGMATIYCVLEGVWCDDGAEEAIVDWCEVHADSGRFRLLSGDWLRDEYGRLLANLQDLTTGEVLTDYLIERGVAKDRPHHYLDVLTHLMQCKEPDDASW